MKSSQETNKTKKKISSKTQVESQSVELTKSTTEFPLGRIRTIMKSSLDTGQITSEVLFLMAKSTEMFIQQLTKETYANIKDGSNRQIKYENLSQLVQQKENLEFLLQIIPHKIKVRDFKHIIQQGSSDSSSSDSEC